MNEHIAHEKVCIVFWGAKMKMLKVVATYSTVVDLINSFAVWDLSLESLISHLEVLGLDEVLGNKC